MANTPEEGAVTSKVVVVPEELLESDEASLVTGMTLVRAWRDPVFRARLLAEPREVLVEMGLRLPDGVAVRVFEDTPAVKHVVLTGLTSEPEELAPLFRELLPLKEGSEVRIIQHTEQALCLVVPLAPAEPETVIDPERLRRLAPRASVWAQNNEVVVTTNEIFIGQTAVAELGAAVYGIEAELAAATANILAVQAAAGYTIAVTYTQTFFTEEEAAATTTTAVAEQTATTVTTEAEAVETTTTVVTEAEVAAVEAEAAATTTTAAAEAEVATVEAEAVATSTTAAAEAEAVAVAVIVAT
jgi:nitrile hydratase alpha subunit